MSSKPLAALLASLLVVGTLGTVMGTSIASGTATPATTGVSGTETGETARLAGETATDTAATGTDIATTEATITDTTTATPRANASLGAEISGFLLASAAGIDGRVESGMWLVAFERAPNLSVKQRVLDRRVAELDDHLDRIETRADDVFGDKNDTSVLRRARRARLAGELGALRAAISETKTAATQVGVDAAEIKQLSEEASNVTLPPTVAVLERRSSAPLVSERAGADRVTRAGT